MGFLDTLKSLLPVSSRSAHAMHREIGEMHSELDSFEYEMQTTLSNIQTMLWEMSREEGESTLEAKKRFFLNLAPATGDLRERQLAAAELLREFDAFCEENDLTYWIAQGTLLGAIRHKGFIPWDDDIDVGMTRQEIDRALAAAAVSDAYKITVRYDFDVYCRQVRFCRKDSDCEAFIDLFCFDPVKFASASTMESYEDARTALVGHLDSLQPLDYWNHESQYVEKGIPAGEVVTSTFEEAVEQLYGADGICTTDLDSAEGLIWAIDNIESRTRKHDWYVVPKDEVLPLVEVSFEGSQYPAPCNPGPYFERYIGDIYSLPEGRFAALDHSRT